MDSRLKKSGMTLRVSMQRSHARSSSLDQPSSVIRTGRGPDAVTHDSIPTVVNIGVLSNPLSGANRKGFGGIKKLLAGYPGIAHQEVMESEEITKALGKFASDQVNLIVVNGGDGTIQAVLSALKLRNLFDRSPLLVTVPAGTTSMIAGDVGLRGNRLKALHRLVRWSKTGQPCAQLVERRLLRVRVGSYPEPRFGMFLGAGGIHQAYQFWERTFHPWGVRGELIPGLVLAWFLFGLLRGRLNGIQPVPMTIGLDGAPGEKQEYLAVFVSTLNRFFLGLRPFWGSEAAPLRYTAIRARPRHIVRVLPSLLRGKANRHVTPEHGYMSRNVHEILLTSSTGCMLDGELLEPATDGSVCIEDGGPVTFLQV